MATNCVVCNVTRAGGASVPTTSSGVFFVNCATDGDAALNETCQLLTAGDIAAGKVFKSYASGDYQPAFGGPLVNTGVMIPGWDLLVDLAGKKRVKGSKLDIGAYEGPTGGFGLILR